MHTRRQKDLYDKDTGKNNVAKKTRKTEKCKRREEKIRC